MLRFQRIILTRLEFACHSPLENSFFWVVETVLILYIPLIFYYILRAYWYVASFFIQIYNLRLTKHDFSRHTSPG